MKAAYITQPGPPESIIIGELANTRTHRRSGAGPREGRRRESDRHVRPQRHGEDGHPAAIHRRLPIWPASSKSCGPKAKRVQSRRSGVGNESGTQGRQGTFAEYAAVDEGWLYPASRRRQTTRRPPRVRWSASPRIWVSSVDAQTAGAAKRCSSTAAPAASARWSCKWPRRSVPA